MIRLWKVADFTAEELAESLSVQQHGFSKTLYSKEFKEIQSIERIEKNFSYPSILLSEAVFVGYKKEKPKANDIIEGLWKEQTRKIRDIDFKIYGANLTWILS